MTCPDQPISQVAKATQALANCLGTVVGPDGNALPVVTTVAASVSPPAVVVGPPRLRWSDYGSVFSGQPTTAQWNVYLVVALNQYAIDALLAIVTQITASIERFTPGVVLGAGPGLYPSPNGSLPAYIIVCQMEVVMV